MSRPFVIAIALVAGCLVAPAADGALPRYGGVDPPPDAWTTGRPLAYPDPVIGYSAPRRWATSARFVTGWLNRADIGVRLVEVPRSQAQLIIRTDPAASCRGGGRRAGIGGPNSDGTKGVAAIGNDCRGVAARLMLAHEVGHALGLPHEFGRCSTMNPQFWVKNRRFSTISRLSVRRVQGGWLRWRIVRDTRLCLVRSISKELFTPDDVAQLRARFAGPGAATRPLAGGVAGLQPWVDPAPEPYTDFAPVATGG